MILTFDPVKVAKLIDHAFKSPDHKIVYGDENTRKPGLWFVGDHGIYLMSNGLPSLPNPEKGGTKQLVVYADECDPYKVSYEELWENKVKGFGSDDGCEFLDLSKLTYDCSMPIRAFKIECTKNKMHVHVTQDSPLNKPAVKRKPRRNNKQKHD
jgi:hypothetical protein